MCEDLYLSSRLCRFRDGKTSQWIIRLTYSSSTIGLIVESKRAQESEEGDEEGGDSEEQREKKARKRVSPNACKILLQAQRAEATLVKDFNAIQLKKFDLEFSVDPLFKKTSADFDEGGAKGLLLNHLSLDGEGRIVFDASDTILEEDENEKAEISQDGDLALDLGDLQGTRSTYSY